MNPSVLVAASALTLVACKPTEVPQGSAEPAAVVSPGSTPSQAPSRLAVKAPAPDWLEGEGSSATPPQAAQGDAPLSGQAAEIQQERIVQRDLPKSGDPLWKILRTTKVREDPHTGLYTAVHSPQVEALAGKTLTVSGFMLPIEQADMTRHFLLSRYTPVCFFCPPGDPNEVVEVRTRRPLKAGYDMVKVTGTFTLANNGEKGLFFRLEGGS